MKPSDVTETNGKMRHVTKKKAVAWKRAKLKKQSPVRAPPAAATRKTEHVSKIKATTITTTTTAKTNKNQQKQPTAKRRRCEQRGI
ncbi:hypothetical protein E2986_12938 [Frieseomelitta varia]|uniref:Uncharacterized protein n=1 Tax=Frieseomelitta varia TaxID=561572 RepID=A0A833SGA5_9HYME|nr:hypothetical protein E2986_12938 [Frieseomelitta varia]